MDATERRDKWLERIEEACSDQVAAGGPLLYFPDSTWNDLPELYAECGRIFANSASEARDRLIVFRRIQRQQRRLLLFGITAAAYEAGSGGRLWPEVQERFLGAYPQSRVQLSHFQQGFAPLFTECWEAEVRDTEGRLFVPVLSGLGAT